MATVTFPIELGGSGLVVSDDTDPTTGLRNGGYQTRFVPALQQTVAVAGFVVGQVSNAAASASAAAGSASAASSSASSAASSAASAATLYDQFDDRYLGPKASNPTVDNGGNALLVGAMYFNTAALETRVWNGTTWQTASVNGGTVNSLIVTGALQYQGTLTGGTGVIDIGGGQIFKDALGNVGFGTATPDLFARGFTCSLGISSAGTSAIAIDGVTGSFAEFGFNGTRYGSIFSASANEFSVSAIGASTNFRVLTNENIRFTIDPAGNAGLGVVPSAWQANTRALDIGSPTDTGAVWSGVGVDVALSGNAFYRAGNFNYKLTAFATSYEQEDGVHRWKTAPSGTAGNPITFTQAMTLTQGGNLLVGTTVDGVARHRVEVGSQTYIYEGLNAATSVYQVLASGSVQNATNSYGAISDPKLKDIIGPKSSTWEKTKQYNWIEYYLKSDTEHTFKMLGLNAEEAQAVSPGVVDESPDLVEVTKVRQVPVQIVRLDENESPVVDEETGEVIYDEVIVDEEYTEWEPNGEFTKSVKYSVVSMQYHRTTQECQQRIESLEAAKVQADDLIQQIMARVAALESASA